jgi:hypothetical protein
MSAHDEMSVSAREQKRSLCRKADQRGARSLPGHHGSRWIPMPGFDLQVYANVPGMDAQTFAADESQDEVSGRSRARRSGLMRP